MSGLQAKQRDQLPLNHELRLLLQLAEQGDREALPVLRQFLDERPEFWREAGNLALHAERAGVALAAGTSLVASESVKRQLEALRTAIGGPSPSPLERLLVERVVLTWLHVNYADMIAAQNRPQNLSPSQQDCLQRGQERAQRRHLQAIKALALVRKLIAPSGKERPERVRGPAPEIPRPLLDRLQLAGVTN